MALVRVVGAGIAGLACAVELAGAGHQIVLHEAAGQAGGRCRSYFDPALERIIDNGNHLLLGANRAALTYLGAIGAESTLAGPSEPAFPFLDLATGERWSIRPDGGIFPQWIFDPARRVPSTRAIDYLQALRLAWAGEGTTVADCLGGGLLFRRLWEPLAVAVLNVSAHEGAARLLWPVIRQVFGHGGNACRPLIACESLRASLIDPALAFLAARDVEVRFNDRLRALVWQDDRVVGVSFGSRNESVGPEDAVVLAVPPSVAAELIPSLVVPEGTRAIVNGHFRLADNCPGVQILGLVGGTAQWLFVRGDVASVTVSAADALAEQPAEAIAVRLWTEVVRALQLRAASLPAFRIIKERRATFAQVPSNLARRPGPITTGRNLLLAGDWTDTGLPATLEGAAFSGQRAARFAASVTRS